MWFRLRAAIIKELLCYFRDPSTRRFLSVVPIFQTMIFAFAASMDVQNIDIAVLDEDVGRWSHEMVARVDGAWFSDEILPVHNREQLHALIEQRRVILGLHIGQDFSRRIAAGEPAQVQVIVDGRRANGGQIAVSYLQQVAAEISADLVSTAAMTPESAPIASAMTPRVNLRHWFNTNLDFRQFMVVNLTATMAMMMCLMVTGLSLARERETGTFDQLLVSPLTPIEIIISKMFPGLLAGFVVSLLVLLIAITVFNAPFNGSVFALLLGLLVFVLSVVGFGLLISAFSQTQQQAVLGTFFSTIPFIITSGFMTPYENMPQWLQTIAVINPLKHYLMVVQGCIFRGQSLLQVLDNIWPLAVIGVVTFSLAVVVVRRKLA